VFVVIRREEAADSSCACGLLAADCLPLDAGGSGPCTSAKNGMVSKT
jgi:hypothetical protein